MAKSKKKPVLKKYRPIASCLKSKLVIHSCGYLKNMTTSQTQYGLMPNLNVLKNNTYIVYHIHLMLRKEFRKNHACIMAKKRTMSYRHSFVNIQDISTNPSKTNMFKFLNIYFFRRFLNLSLCKLNKETHLIIRRNNNIHCP